MKAQLISVLIGLTASTFAQAQDMVAGVPVVDGRIEYVICSAAPLVNILDDSLTRTQAVAKNLDEVHLAQSFAASNRVSVGDKIFLHAQVEGQKIGWVDAADVSLRSSCAHTPQPLLEAEVTTPDPDGLNDSTCCRFPVNQRPSESYLIDQKKFRAARVGRLHAACDLYRTELEPVVAVAPGTVIRGRYAFYEGVDAIEVQHTGGYVVRYGEVTHKKTVAKIKLGAKVKTGDTVGYVGKVNSGCCTPMLHFELYSGKAKGALTTKIKPFDRRSDLLDPSQYLGTWEQNQFGARW